MVRTFVNMKRLRLNETRSRGFTVPAALKDEMRNRKEITY